MAITTPSSAADINVAHEQAEDFLAALDVVRGGSNEDYYRIFVAAINRGFRAGRALGYLEGYSEAREGDDDDFDLSNKMDFGK